MIAQALLAVMLAVTPTQFAKVNIGDTRTQAEAKIGSKGWFKVQFFDENGNDIRVRWYFTGDPLARASVLYRVGPRHKRVQATQWCTRPNKTTNNWTCKQVKP